MKHVAVIGKPILHNLTPLVWNRAFQKRGMAAHAFRMHPHTAKQAIQAIFELRLAGCLVAPPFTQDMLKYLDEADNSVKVLGAVTVIQHCNGRLIGYNTEPDQLIETLREHGVEPEEKQVVILGINHITQAAIYGLLQANAGDVVLLDRSYEKAIRMATHMGCRVAYFGRLKTELARAQILVSCLSSYRTGIRKEWLHRHLTVFETVAASTPRLLEDARQMGCHTFSGTSQAYDLSLPALKRFFGEDPLSCIKGVTGSSVRNRTDSIALIGFMGAGKTMISRRLADLTGQDVIDTDKLIEEKAGERIPDIFRKYGEGRFRELERTFFEQLDFKGKIISCGGGVVKDESIRTLLRRHTTVVWIWSSLATTLARVTRGTRPLLDVDNLEDHAKHIFHERIPLYAECADIMMINEGISTRNLAKKIYQELF